MKANAPEKIYIACDVVTEEGRDFILERPVNYLKSVEYARTDAFVEKACVKLKKLMYDNLMFQGRLHQEEIIERFIEDFKNHIKG